MGHLKKLFYFFVFALLLVNTGAAPAPSPPSHFTTIKSPGYPNNYPPNQNRSWVTTSRSDQPLEITFLDFSLEPKHAQDKECVRDKLTLREGSGEIIYEGCGNQLPPRMTSKTNQVITTFESDSNFQKRGFYLHLRDTSYVKSWGSLKSSKYPENYDANETSTWTISAPLGQKVEIEFVDFDIEPRSNTPLCNKDKLVIQELPSLKTIFEGCGNTTPSKLLSESNQLFVTLESDDNIERRGFYLRWEAIPSKAETATILSDAPIETATTIPTTTAIPNKMTGVPTISSTTTAIPTIPSTTTTIPSTTSAMPSTTSKTSTIQNVTSISIPSVVTTEVTPSPTLALTTSAISQNSNSFPHQVIIQSSKRFCQGSILSPSIILTAASCVMKLKDHPETLSITTTTNSPQNFRPKAIFVDVFSHYDKYQQLAYLVLSSPLTMNDTEAQMDIAKLPRSEEEFEEGRLSNPFESRVGSGLFCKRERSTQWILCGIRNKKGEYIPVERNLKAIHLYKRLWDRSGII